MMGTDRNPEQSGTKATATEHPPEEDAGIAAAAEAAVDAGAPVEAAALAERLIVAEAEVARLKDDYLRALAEIENVRRRAARDRQDASQYAIAGFARDLLAVADNLRRALASVDDAARQSDPALDALTSGVEMTEKELLAVFERYGVKPIAAEGQIFDPHVHEALFEIPNEAVAHGTVVQVLQAGYTLHDRTLRPARVGIAKGGPKPGGQPEAAAAAAAAADADEGPIAFPQRGGGDAYRKPDDDDGETAGARIDETH